MGNICCGGGIELPSYFIRTLCHCSAAGLRSSNPCKHMGTTEGMQGAERGTCTALADPKY